MATAGSTQAEQNPSTTRRPRVWPWALLGALVFAAVLPMLLWMAGVPDAQYLAMTAACAAVGAVVVYALAPHPRLRIVLLSGSVLTAAAWAAWCYRTNMHRWRPDLGDDYAVPWGVSNIPEWAVVAQPIAVGLCVVVALVALVRLRRGQLVRTAWWTALLCVALLVCLVAGFQVLSARAYTA